MSLNSEDHRSANCHSAITSRIRDNMLDWIDSPDVIGVEISGQTNSSVVGDRNRFL